MSFYILDRLRKGAPTPALRQVTKLGGSFYTTWGRFRPQVLGSLSEAFFEDAYDLSSAEPLCLSRNKVMLDMRGDKTSSVSNILVGAHAVLPDGFKGRCFHAEKWRVHCDYSRKTGAPHDYFSVLALLLLKKDETLCFDDWIEGRRRRITLSWNASGVPDVMESDYDQQQ